MGFMDKVKEGVSSADKKIGNAILSQGLDSKIREQEREIQAISKEISDAVLVDLRENKEIDRAALEELFAKILEAEQKIEELKVQKECIKEKKD